MPPTSSATASIWTLSARPQPRWNFRASESADIGRLQREAGCTPLLARVMAARGFGEGADVDDFLAPALAKIHDPFRLKGMEEAVARIMEAIDRRRTICVYGDYDVDGICSTAILKLALEYLGAKVVTYIPHRLNEGYGLREGAIHALKARGVDLIVTVDNGTTALAEVDLANSLGMSVVITDHHETGPVLPAAAALVNPKQAGCEYPFKELCGAGVAFKLAHGLLKRAAPDSAAAKEFLKSLLDFVTLGTVADVVPLVGENRRLVSHGLRKLRTQCRPGLRSLLELNGGTPDEIRAFNLAFTLAPRLNAAGRTEHADVALDLLLTEDPARARELALKLDRYNEERRRIEGDITEEALCLIDETVEAPIIVVQQEGWHLGVVGIVASRILERYYRPVIVLGVDGEWAKGSARSIKGFDVHAALTACGSHLEQFGGHQMAAGLRLRASAIPAFREAITAYAKSALTEKDLSPSLTIDAVAPARELTLEGVQSLDRLAPFGSQNPRPLLAIEDLTPLEAPRVLKERHLKLRLGSLEGQSFSAIGFSMGHRAAELQGGFRKLKIAGTPVINRWNGQTRLELELKDFIVER